MRNERACDNITSSNLQFKVCVICMEHINCYYRNLNLKIKSYREFEWLIWYRFSSSSIHDKQLLQNKELWHESRQGFPLSKKPQGTWLFLTLEPNHARHQFDVRVIYSTV